MNRLADLTAFGLAAMTIVSGTLEAWSEEILRGGRLTRTNGITKGFQFFTPLAAVSAEDGPALPAFQD